MAPLGHRLADAKLAKAQPQRWCSDPTKAAKAKNAPDQASAGFLSRSATSLKVSNKETSSRRRWPPAAKATAKARAESGKRTAS